MSSSDHLDEAISRGIIQPEQAKALRELSDAPAGIAVEPAPALTSKLALDAEDDESFRFVSGFNDIFLALGVVMLLYGLTISNISTGIQGHLLAAALTWGLAEIFAGWLKRVLPSMIAVTMFVYHVLNIARLVIDERDLTSVRVSDLFGVNSTHAISGYVILAGIAAALAIYARFKLPFSLFLAGLQIILLVVTQSIKRNYMAEPSYFIPFLFIVGLALFALAMWFDMKDCERKNRLSDNAFWLHLLASPLIVHSIMWQSAIWTIGAKSANPNYGWQDIATPLAIIVLAIFVMLMIIALIIDRRAMLVSSFIYVSVAVTFFITRQGEFLSAASFTPVLIGITIISMGVGWRHLRKMIFTILPLGIIEPRLPPVRS